MSFAKREQNPVVAVNYRITHLGAYERLVAAKSLHSKADQLGPVTSLFRKDSTKPNANPLELLILPRASIYVSHHSNPSMSPWILALSLDV